jgi:hypothetical protein
MMTTIIPSDDTATKYRRCQAYSECLTRHILCLIDRAEKEMPSAATLVEACRVSIREAAKAFKEQP